MAAWLDTLAALTGRELRGFFTSLIAWVAMTVFLLVNGVLFLRLIEFYAAGDGMTVSGAFHLFRFSLILLSFLCPALTMHLLAAEWDDKTIEGLLTAPVTDAQVVLSKWLGAMGFFAVMVGTMTLYLVILGLYGRWDLGPLAASFLGLMFVGGLFTSFGLLASSWTRSQLVAFLITFLFNILLTWGTNLLDGALGPQSDLRVALATVMIERHFGEMTQGLVRSSACVFFLSSITLFLFLTVRSLESRKWS